MRSTLRAVSVMALLCVPDLANAEHEDVAPKAGTWFTQNGAVIINYRNKSSVTLDGNPVPGAQANVHDDLTLGNGYGYVITPNVSVMAVLGVGPQTAISDNNGTRLGKMWYGAPSLVVDYHFNQFGAFQPFVGIGGSYIWVLQEYDGFIQNLKIDSTLGLVLRGGAEVMIDKNFGLFAAANKIFADTEAHGRVDGAPFGAPGTTLPIAATVDLDPWIFQLGLTYRFDAR